MITLSPIGAIILYLTVILSSILLVWFFYHIKARKTKLILSEKRLQQCEYCHFAYLTSIGRKVSQCPSCRCYNQ